jgi:class 3 adenylate cyclase
MTPADESLHDQLELRNKQIDLMLAIDRVRDSADDERALLTAAVSAMCQTMGVDLCLISLFDPDTHQLELRALIDHLGTLDQAGEDALRRMAQRASELSGAQQMEVDEVLGAQGFAHWLAAPLRVRHEPLGAVLLVNRQRAFTPGDHTLLDAAISQLDSAVLHMRTLYELRHERQELRTLYTIDRIRDKGLPFNDMLNAVLNELCQAIPSESGFIMLFDTSGQQLELRAATDRDLLNVIDHYRIVYAAATEAVQRGHPVTRSQSAGQIRSLICVPLILNERIIGVLGVLNRHERGEFTRADRHLLWAIASQIDTAIFEGLQIQKYREVFGRRVGPQVMERLLAASDRDALKGERVVVSTLFSDIRGFTLTAEKIDPEVLVQILNDHLSAMTEIVIGYEGTVDKFVGDCVMALYNAPERQPDHALRAVRTAVSMMQAHQALMQKWSPMLPPIGIGIDTGETIVGNFGSTQRNEYTAISRHVNLASRLCGIAEAQQIVISDNTYELVREGVIAEPLHTLKLKGIIEAVQAYQVTGLK